MPKDLKLTLNELEVNSFTTLKSSTYGGTGVHTLDEVYTCNAHACLGTVRCGNTGSGSDGGGGRNTMEGPCNAL